MAPAAVMVTVPAVSSMRLPLQLASSDEELALSSSGMVPGV